MCSDSLVEGVFSLFFSFSFFFQKVVQKGFSSRVAEGQCRSSGDGEVVGQLVSPVMLV